MTSIERAEVVHVRGDSLAALRHVVVEALPGADRAVGARGGVAAAETVPINKVVEVVDAYRVGAWAAGGWNPERVVADVGLGACTAGQPLARAVMDGCCCFTVQVGSEHACGTREVLCQGRAV